MKTQKAQAHIDGLLVARMGMEFAREFRGVYPDEMLGWFMAVGPMQSYIGLAIANGHLKLVRS